MQSHGEHDLDVRIGALRVAVEVTAHTSRTTEQFNAALYDPGALAAAPGCMGTWNLTLSGLARVNRVRERAPSYLARLEQAGITQFWVSESISHPDVARIWDDLRVESGVLLSDSPREQMILNPAAGIESIHNDSVVDAVEVEAAKLDNIRKLRDARADEAHLFVFISEFMTSPRRAMALHGVPLRLSALPDGVDRAWVAARAFGKSDHVVWSVSPLTGWESFGTIPLPELPYPAL